MYGDLISKSELIDTLNKFFPPKARSGITGETMFKQIITDIKDQPPVIAPRICFECGYELIWDNDFRLRIAGSTATVLYISTIAGIAVRKSRFVPRLRRPRMECNEIVKELEALQMEHVKDVRKQEALTEAIRAVKAVKAVKKSYSRPVYRREIHINPPTKLGDFVKEEEDGRS